MADSKAEVVQKLNRLQAVVVTAEEGLRRAREERDNIIVDALERRIVSERVIAIATSLSRSAISKIRRTHGSSRS